MDQNYDQRGGLCQACERDIVVTANPIDPDYISYWKEIGLGIPHLISINSSMGDPECTLSESIINNKEVQQEIKQLAGPDARIEFCYIEETESHLSRILGLPVYCNFDISIPLSRKLPFKNLCRAISLTTPESYFSTEREELLHEGKKLLKTWSSILIKANCGSGGICSGGMFKADTEDELETALAAASKTGQDFYLEKIIHPKMGEIAVHWEIDERGNLLVIGVFDQLSNHFGYDGVCYPSALPEPVIRLVRHQLTEQLAPYLIEKGALGYFCADIVIDDQGIPNWVDFNPRKGAILYVRDMVRRISERYFQAADCPFWHEHIQIPANRKISFSHVFQKISDMLDPRQKPFVVITNPGVIPFGYVDITGISRDSKEEAFEFFKKARQRLL